MVMIFIRTMIFCLLLNTPMVYANTKQLLNQHQQHLKQVKSQIIHLQKNIVQDKNKKENLQKQLRDTELSINASQKKLTALNKTMTSQQHKISTLEKEQQEKQQQLQEQRQLLKKQLLDTYILGRESYIKAMLNEEDPNTTQRMMTYYQYFNERRLRNIHDMDQLIEHINQGKRALLKENSQLQSLLEHRQKTQDNLNQEKFKREQLFQAISHRLHSRQSRLQNLKKDETTLAQLITKLHREEQTLHKTNFHQRRGHLDWPTKGQVVAHFGSSIEHSELLWNGVLIQAPESQPVYAIATGTVVFADWLTGFGLLLIIDHGQDYLTLYGRNHALYKKVGETVQQGDRIADVGKSGGFAKSGLYFEIRKHGHPLNPEKWCHKGDIKRITKSRSDRSRFYERAEQKETNHRIISNHQS